MRWLALLFALGAGGVAGEIDLPPQAIHAPLPLMPWEAVGGVVPASATVELTVGPRGQVTKVEVTTMQPPTSAEGIFRAAIQSTLGTWRYAPAIRDGKPAEAVLKMQIQFRPVEPDREAHRSTTKYAMGFVGADDPEAAAWAWRLDALDQEGFLEQRKQALAAADALIAPGKRRELNATHVQVVTDASKPEVPAIIARNLEAVYAALDTLFRDVGPYKSPRAPLTAYVFEADRTMHEFAVAFAPMPEASGLYLPLGLILFHLELPSTESLLNILMHETTHAFVDRYLVRRGVWLPTWLAEGLAEYVGNSDVTGGHLKPGSHKAYVTYRGNSSPYRDRSISSVDAATVKAALKHGTSVPVAKLLGTSASRFYGKDWSLYYTQSWLLVHFLRHGRPGWSEKQFPTFLLYAAEGFPVEDVVTQVYGLDGEALEQAYREYVLKF